MNDLEMTKLCAQAMGYRICCEEETYCHTTEAGCYYPIDNDAQAMALVKRLKLSVGFNQGWGCVKNDERGMLLSGAYHYDTLNRAIVQCVANMKN